MIDRLVRFGAVGSVGFIVDTGVLLFLTNGVGLAPLPSRIVSFLIAATVTFVLNWRFTFRFDGSFEFGRLLHYWTLTALGACVNIGIYRLWIETTDSTSVNLVAGTALGSLAALLVNYLVSSRLIFKNE